MRWIRQLKLAIRRTYDGVKQKHTSQLAAGLSYYFILSLFPLLITFAAALALVPVPGLFDQILRLMAKFIPPDSMGLVRAIVKDVISPHGRSIFSLGIVGTIWAASGGVAALVEAVNVAYGAADSRTFLRRRLIAIGLMFALGTLAIMALSLLVVGPHFGSWLAEKIRMGPAFAIAWPYLRWALSITSAILCIELLYAWAPAKRPRFLSTLPGALMALVTWVVLSSALGLYLRNFGRLNKTYGVLAAAVALMLWLYWTAFSILVGAHFNAESSQYRPELQEKQTLAERRPDAA